MITKIPGGLSPVEFDQLIDTYIEREDPHAISLDVLVELDTEATPRAKPIPFEFLGRFVAGRLELLPLLPTGSFEVEDNEIRLPNGWRVVMQVKPPTPATI